MISRALLRSQFVVYIAGGVLSALIDIGVMLLLLRFGLPAIVATSAGFGIGLLVNYAFHSNITFKKISTPKTFTRFLCVVALNYMLTVGLVALAVWWHAAPLIGKILSLPVVALNGFILGRYWIYE